MASRAKSHRANAATSRPAENLTFRRRDIPAGKDFPLLQPGYPARPEIVTFRRVTVSSREDSRL